MGNPVDFLQMMALEPHGPDTFVGTGPDYPWGGLYGGQIVAQALRAAALTVDAQYRVHSLHAFFIRRGDSTEPIRFEVDRLRNGRSFVTRAVVARQSTGAILNMSASFQVNEEAEEITSAVLPEVPSREDLPSDGWSPMFERRYVSFPEPGRVGAWFSLTEPLPDDPVLHACALAYMSDDLASDSARDLVQPGPSGGEDLWFGTSLDHAIWFHRPQQADQPQLQEFRCAGMMSSRGLSLGQVFTAEGTHVATVAQEVLLRRRRPDGKA
jgi:acyl-CoA thioesterase-2